MLQKLKKQSIKSAIKGLIGYLIATVVIVVLFDVLMDVPMLASITGGTDIMDLDIDSAAGEWVSMDVDIPLGVFVTETNQNETREWNYWLVPTPDGEHLIALRVGLWLDKRTDTKLMDMMYDYFYNGVEAPPLRVQGTLTRMSGTLTSYYREEIGDWGIDTDIAHLYYIDVNSGYGFSTQLFYLLAGLWALLGLYQLANIILSATGVRQKPVRKFAASRGDEATELAKLDEWFEAAPQPSKDSIWLAPDFILTRSGARNKIHDLTKAVWAYKRVTKRNGVVSSVNVILNFADKKTTSLSVTDAGADQVLEYLLHNTSHIAIGHTTELARLFKKDRNALRASAQQQRAGIAQATGAPAPTLTSTESENDPPTGTDQ